MAPLGVVWPLLVAYMAEGMLSVLGVGDDVRFFSTDGDAIVRFPANEYLSQNIY